MKPSLVKGCQGHMDTAYRSAILALNSLQAETIAPTTLESLHKRFQTNYKWLNIIGYQASDLDILKAVHVAGTKGKGSTCNYVSNLLQNTLKSPGKPLKVGLYTSPHMIHVRERIRIDGEPVSKDLFSKHFNLLWEKINKESEKPSYFQFLTLLAFHIFISEKVDCAVIEVGLGGKFDTTNIIDHPVVTAITILDYDHEGILGTSLSNIARQKAGIMKPNVPCLTVNQKPEAIDELKLASQETQAPLRIITDFSEDYSFSNPMSKQNFALSLAIVDIFTKKLSYLPIEKAKIQEVAKSTTWPGRCQILNYDNMILYIDGAHTKISIQYATQWFLDTINKAGVDLHDCVFIYSQKNRKEDVLLGGLSQTIKAHSTSQFARAIFCLPYLDDSKDKTSESFSALRIPSVEEEAQLEKFKKVWVESFNNDNNHVNAPDPILAPNISVAFQHAIEISKMSQKPLHVFVTGSLYLAGGILKIYSEKDSL